MTKGQIFIVSTGQGNKDYLTYKAFEILQNVDLVVGYTKYVDEIKDFIEIKDSYATGMTQEVDRCKYAVKQALENRSVAVVSNGDVNVFGMAGLVLEIIDENDLWDQLDVVVEPGITSMLAAASKIGAPIIADFAVVSLSDKLTPLNDIIKRLQCAIDTDFVLGIYNPLAKTRKEPFQKFIEVLSPLKNDQRPIALATDLGRETETIRIFTMEDFLEIDDYDKYINMSTVIIVGNSKSHISKNHLHIITPRGYDQSYDYIL